MSASQSSSPDKPGPVIVSAGRRVDAPDATTPRFPQQNVAGVRAKVEDFLQQQKPSVIVSSGACGADLLLLQAAQRGRIPRYVLLPSSPEEFRESSVTDRPGDWGTIYDDVLKDSQVEILKLPSGQEGYLETNLRLLERGQALAAELGTSATVLVIWNQETRGDDDVTAHFLREATQRNIPISEISTL
jgi:hypothetical protein